jgi:hypothetical protein
MDDFFWGALINNVIHAFLIIGLGFAALFLLLRYYLGNRTISGGSMQAAGHPSDDRKTLLPLRLQAYERFVLFLERINPPSMLMRLNQPELSATQLQALLVRTIRDEFEYNLSQQIYISANAWEMIRNAKEETTRLINQAAASLPEGTSAADLARTILELSVSGDSLSMNRALDELKKEVKQLF